MREGRKVETVCGYGERRSGHGSARMVSTCSNTPKVIMEKCLGYDTVPKRTVAIYLFRSFPATAAGPGWLARAVLLYCTVASRAEDTGEPMSLRASIHWSLEQKLTIIDYY